MFLLASGIDAASAQQAVVPPASPPDPLTDMAPLPELGLDWPDPGKIDAAAEPAPASASTGSPASDQAARYRVVLVGYEPLGEPFRARFLALSALATAAAKPANAAQIERRAASDRALLHDLLRAAGRYDGEVSSALEPAHGLLPATVRLSLRPGPAYRYTGVTLPGLAAAGAAARGFAVKAGDPVNADAVLAAVAALKAQLGRSGFPFATLGDPRLVVDHASHGAALTVPVSLGARARFGRIVPEGPNPIFSVRHLGTIARFQAGDAYDAHQLDDFRRALIATGLASVATIRAIPTADPGVVDVGVRIERAPPRTVSAELGYGTGQGARVALSWEHRNLLPPEGAVTFAGVGGTREQSLGVTLRRGNVAARDRVLTAQAVFSHSDFDAYEARTLTIGGTLERQTNIIWQKKWVWSGGAELVATNERDTNIDTGDKRRRSFLIAAAPGSLAYDGTDDLLNPSRGWRLSGHASPELSLHDGATLYARLQVDASGYLPIGDHLVLAARVRVASIVGAARADIAPSRRIYSGGGGSVRGFGYQKLGPLAVDGTPVGGRGLTEFGTEARIRFGNFGVVPFLDWGQLVTSSVPSFSGFRFGTGIGARYYSSFGPIRIDVGTPIDRRNGDPRVALYVSLGQAF